MADESVGFKAGRVARGVPRQAGRVIRRGAEFALGLDTAIKNAPFEFYRGLIEEEPAPQVENSPAAPTADNNWMSLVSLDSLRGALPAPGSGVLRTTDPELRARQDAEDATRAAEAKKAEDDEMLRRTIRAFKDPKTGVWNFNNTGAGGDVVMKNGAAQGPDVGAAGRGAVMTGGGLDDPLKDPNYRNYLLNGPPGALAEATKERADVNLHDTLAGNPYAREYVMADIQRRQQEAATANTYARERAKQQAEQDSRASLLGVEADIDEAYQNAVRNLERSNATQEEKQQALLYLEQKRDAEKRRAGIPSEAAWSRLG